MKPNLAQTVHHTGTQPEENIRYSIDQRSIEHIFSVLTNLYPDPIVAVVREYSTNARDSHIQAGNPNPIEVTLPTPLSPNFVVKDQGIGMSMEDFRTYFSMYGASSKRDSDEVTGVLGLGCKCGLTYSGAALGFTVEAIQAGLKVTALITKDERGVGCIKVMDTVTTSEQNGVKISIPVRQNDFGNFKAAAENLFLYWPEGSVLVNGQEPKRVDGLWLDPDICVLTASRYESRIIMGGVAYPFAHSNFGRAIVAWVPMGSVNFTPARDALHSTQLTRDTIETIENFVQVRFGEELIRQIEAAPSPYERAKLLYQWQAETRGLTSAHKVKFRSFGDITGFQKRYGDQWKRMWEMQGDSCSMVSSVGFDRLARPDIVITHFPNRQLSRQNKDRLRAFHGTARFIVLPDDVTGTDLSCLEGRPQTFTWEEILSKTPQPERVKRGATTKSGTLYTVQQMAKNPFTAAVIPDDAPLLFTVQPSNCGHIMQVYPNHRLVLLQPRMVQRFRRLHPWAEAVGERMAEERKTLLAQLTPRDRISATSLYGYYIEGLRKRAKEILDPQLREVVTLWNTPTDRVSRLQMLNVPVAEIAKDSPTRIILDRYPLLQGQRYSSTSNTIDDMLFYVNTKYVLQLNPQPVSINPEKGQP